VELFFTAILFTISRLHGCLRAEKNLKGDVFERSGRKNCRQAKGFMHAAKAGFFNSSTAPYFLWIFWKFILDG